MNYAPGIFEYLAKSSDFAEILLAPGTAPVHRSEKGLAFTEDKPLTAQDVRDTLGVLIGYASGGNLGGAKAGSFSIGVPNRGRFRISFMTQRGTPAISIQKVPPEAPRLEELLDSPEMVASADAAFRAFHSGLLVITGSHTLSADVLVYALLRSVIEHEQRLLFLIEGSMLCLLKHHRSVVLQCEVGSDVESIAHGIRTVLPLSPDLLCIRNLATPADLNAVLHAVDARVFTVVTVSALDRELLFPEGRVPVGPESLRGVWEVERLAGGRLHLTVGRP